MLLLSSVNDESSALPARRGRKGDKEDEDGVCCRGGVLPRLVGYPHPPCTPSAEAVQPGTPAASEASTSQTSTSSKRGGKKRSAQQALGDEEGPTKKAKEVGARHWAGYTICTLYI